MVMGVTVLKDVLVVILFAVVFSIANTLVTGDGFSTVLIINMILALLASFVMGYLLFMLLRVILYLRWSTTIKSIVILLAGWGVYFISDGLDSLASRWLTTEFHTEPLLICIVASLLVTNYSPYRREFQKIITDTVPLVYVAFFTLIGATINLEIVVASWGVALALFVIWIIGFFAGGLRGRRWYGW